MAGSRPCRTWYWSDVTALNSVVSARAAQLLGGGGGRRQITESLRLRDKAFESTALPSVSKPPPRGEAYISRAMVDARQTSCSAAGGRPWFRRTRSAYNDDEQPLMTSLMCASILRLFCSVTPSTFMLLTRSMPAGVAAAGGRLLPGLLITIADVLLGFRRRLLLDAQCATLSSSAWIVLSLLAPTSRYISSAYLIRLILCMDWM